MAQVQLHSCSSKQNRPGALQMLPELQTLMVLRLIFTPLLCLLPLHQHERANLARANPTAPKPPLTLEELAALPDEELRPPLPADLLHHTSSAGSWTIGKWSLLEPASQCLLMCILKSRCLWRGRLTTYGGNIVLRTSSRVMENLWLE